MWSLERVDRHADFIVQIYCNDELVGSLQFWLDPEGERRYKLWQAAMELLNKEEQKVPVPQSIVQKSKKRLMSEMPDS